MSQSKQIILIAFLILSSNKIFAQDSLRFSHNPFRDSTLISFDISSATKISIIIYNRWGQEVDTIFKDTFLQSGTYAYFFGANLPYERYLISYKINSKRINYLLTKAEIVSTINNASFNSKKIVIFPNPTQGNLNIKFENLLSKPMLIYIYEPAGRLVYRDIFFTSTLGINLSEFENGLYMICIPDLEYSCQLVLMR